MKDLTGLRFGRLVAIKELPPAAKRSNYRWECRCDCGNTMVVLRGNLTTGNTKSCGCARGTPRAKDISGERFGRLTALRPTERKQGTNVVWLCACDCGEQTETSTDNLRSGNVVSCGCYARESHDRLMTYMSENELKDQTSLCLLTAKTRTTNTSGRTGVFFSRNKRKWVANIGFQRKQIHLGYFDKFEDAVKARERAEEKMFEPVLNKYGRTLRSDA